MYKRLRSWLAKLLFGAAKCVQGKRAVKTPSDKYTNDPAFWFQSAENFRAGAWLLFRHGSPFLYFPAAILGHQALEMYLKAALIRKGRQISPSDTWGHDLEALLKDLAGEAEFPELVYNCAKIFNDYFDELRYPRRLKSVEGIGETEGWLLEEAIPFLLPYAKGPRIMT